MTGSARGTAEQCGRNVKPKTGLNRSLLRVAPAEMNASLLRVGERVGARVDLVRAAGTSITCNACTHRNRRNCESQAVFRCRACGHTDTDNADANAARNMRCRGDASIRARMDASGGMDAVFPKKPTQAGRTYGWTRLAVT